MTIEFVSSEYNSNLKRRVPTYGYFKLSQALTPRQLEYVIALTMSRRIDSKNNVVDPTRLGLKSIPQLWVPRVKRCTFSFVYWDCEFELPHTNDPFAAVNGPSASCHWVPDGSGTIMRWDGAPSFDCWKEWILFLSIFVFQPWGIGISGTLHVVGEDGKSTHNVASIQDEAVTMARLGNMADALRARGYINQQMDVKSYTFEKKKVKTQFAMDIAWASDGELDQLDSSDSDSSPADSGDSNVGAFVCFDVCSNSSDAASRSDWA